ncbi:MAG: UDP-N-acetylmuramate--L-alanine ligase [Acidimicrobiales bacterium AG-410-I20]|nr:MAG: UDP-N-acetylmuramate--L-alanine ligase [Acidimicrobiales bacterium AG-410-I20]
MENKFTPNLSRSCRIHILGIGGAGMSAIAEVLVSMGHSVTGSDLKESAGLERLRALGITVTVGHDAKNVGDAEFVARSTAVLDSNVECKEALERQIPLLSRAEVLASICKERSAVVVSGTHGKTTTSSMLALILRTSGLEPSFIIGGDVNEVGTGAAWDKGQLFVVEGDESDGSFLMLPRDFAVVTNFEADHLEHHGGYEALQYAFERFVKETNGPVIVGVDDEGGRKISNYGNVMTLGMDASADWQILEVEEKWTGTSFRLKNDRDYDLNINLPIPGMHNVKNAACAAALGLVAGASSKATIEALERFAGVARRFELRGKVAGITFVDDYAHLPTEVSSTISAAKVGNWKRLISVFQPHRYSRIEALWETFKYSFHGSDLLFVTDIYPSGEKPRAGISGALIADVVSSADPPFEVRYIPRRSDLVDALASELTEGDCCLTMGAGDLTSLPDEVQSEVGKTDG